MHFYKSGRLERKVYNFIISLLQWCVFVSGEDAVSSRATTSAVYTLLLPYFLPLVAAVAPAIYLAIRCVRGDI